MTGILQRCLRRCLVCITTMPAGVSSGKLQSALENSPCAYRLVLTVSMISVNRSAYKHIPTQTAPVFQRHSYECSNPLSGAHGITLLCVRDATAVVPLMPIKFNASNGAPEFVGKWGSSSLQPHLISDASCRPEPNELVQQTTSGRE